MASNDDDIEQLQATIQNTSGVAVTSSCNASKEAEQDDDGKRSFIKFYSCSDIVVSFPDGTKVCLTYGESFDAPHPFSTICTNSEGTIFFFPDNYYILESLFISSYRDYCWSFNSFIGLFMERSRYGRGELSWARIYSAIVYLGIIVGASILSMQNYYNIFPFLMTVSLHLVLIGNPIIIFIFIIL